MMKVFLPLAALIAFTACSSDDDDTAVDVDDLEEALEDAAEDAE